MENDLYADHNVFLYCRKRIELTGISDVIAFSENEVEAEYAGGCISIEGEELKIDEFSSETGKLIVLGTVNGFLYYGRTPKKNKRGLFGR